MYVFMKLMAIELGLRFFDWLVFLVMLFICGKGVFGESLFPCLFQKIVYLVDRIIDIDSRVLLTTELFTDRTGHKFIVFTEYCDETTFHGVSRISNT